MGTEALPDVLVGSGERLITNSMKLPTNFSSIAQRKASGC